MRNLDAIALQESGRHSYVRLLQLEARLRGEVLALRARTVQAATMPLPVGLVPAAERPARAACLAQWAAPQRSGQRGPPPAQAAYGAQVRDREARARRRGGQLRGARLWVRAG